MQVVAHNGPNWNAGALAVQPSTGDIAVGVRSTVLLYDCSGRFTGEIRAVGRGRVSALSFCHAPALTHLLAVGTSDGFIRVFDAQTRRVFRKVREPMQGKRREGCVFAIRFVQRFPNVLLVVTEPNRIRCWRYENANNVQCVVEKELELQSISCVECVPGFSRLVLVGGTSKNDTGVGVVMLVDLSGKQSPHVFHKACVVYDLVVRREEGRDGVSEILLLMVSAAIRRPFMYKSIDGKMWTAIISEDADDVASDTAPSAMVDRNGSTEMKNTRAEYRCSGTWCGPSELLTSDSRGTIVHWHMGDSCRLTERGERQSAHMRQVFSMKSLGGQNEFVSISMDRTIAAWVLVDIESVEPTILLKWRTLRTTGPVKALSLSGPPYDEKQLTSDPRRKASETSVACFSTSDNTITCIGCEKNGVYFMIGELSPFAASSSKRRRESISHLSPCAINTDAVSLDHLQTTNLTLFASSNKRFGIVKLVDGQLEFVCSKRQKQQNGSQAPSMQPCITFCSLGDAAALSVASNGSIIKWVLPNAKESWKESKLTSTFCLGGSFTVGFGVEEKTPSASAACVIPGLSEDKYFLLMGYEDGSVALYAPCGKCIVGPVTTGLSRLTCIAYQTDSKVLVIADKGGSMATSVLDTSQYGREDVKEGVVLEIKHHESLEEAIRYMTWSSSVPQSSGRSEGSYLLAITDNGNALVWVYQEDCTFALRSELKGHSGKVNFAVWESDRCLLTAGEDGTIRKWDLERQPQPRVTNAGVTR